jgi:hypothetical protein
MADITRDSFDFTKRFQKVVHQVGRAVIDSELNEAQDIGRINSYRLARPRGDINLWEQNQAVALDSGLKVIKSGTDDQVLIPAGSYNLGGYIVVLSTAVAVTLTTASGCVYAQLTESEIDGTADTSIVYRALGETTRRTKLNVSFVFSSDQEAYSTGLTQPWEAETAKFLFCHVYRAATGAVADADIVQRLRFPADVEAAQDRGVVMWFAAGGYVHCTGAIVGGTFTVAISKLRFMLPGMHPYVDGGGAGIPAYYEINGSWVLSAGQALVMQADTDAVHGSTRTGQALRRVAGATEIQVITPDAATALGLTLLEDGSHVVAKAVSLSLANLDSRFFMIAYCPTPSSGMADLAILRNNVVVRSGDVCTAFAKQPAIQGTEPALGNPIEARYTAAGILTSVVDCFGFETQVQRQQHLWAGVSASTLVTCDPSWEFLSTAASSCGINAESAYSHANGRCVQLGTTDGNTANMAALVRHYGDINWIPGNSSRRVVAALEFELACSEALAVNNSLTFFFGLFEISVGVGGVSRIPDLIGATPAGFAICKNQGSANLKAYVGNGTIGTFTDTGVTKSTWPSAASCKIVFGRQVVKDVDGDWQDGILFYVDGNLVASHHHAESTDYTPPGTYSLVLVLCARAATGGGTGGVIRLSPVTLSWKRPFGLTAF